MSEHKSEATGLAWSSHAADPLSYAREIASRMRDEPVTFDGISAIWFDKRDNRRFAREIMKRVALQSAPHMMTIVDWARQGWGLADEALRELLLEFQDKGEPIPTYLMSYNMDIVRGVPPRTRGQQKSDNFLRDIGITVLIHFVCDAFGLKPTGRSPHTKSACAVVSEALISTPGVTPLSYKAVEDIWRRYGKV